MAAADLLGRGAALQAATVAADPAEPSAARIETRPIEVAPPALPDRSSTEPAQPAPEDSLLPARAAARSGGTLAAAAALAASAPRDETAVQLRSRAAEAGGPGVRATSAAVLDAQRAAPLAPPREMPMLVPPGEVSPRTDPATRRGAPLLPGFALSASGDTAAPSPTAGQFTLSPPLTGSMAPSGAPSAVPVPPPPGTPVDTNAARWQDALASRIQWLVDHEVGEARIKLNPPELGALDVKISMLEDKTYVQFTAHHSAARDELAQSLPRLRELLSMGGLDVGGATVNGGRDERPAQQSFAGSAGAGASPLASIELPGDLPRLARAAAGRIDIFA
jgi:flagellar hook-length control protein FliK